MRNRFAALLVALAIPLFAVLGLATPALAAYEQDWTTNVTWYEDSSRECVENRYVSGCVQPYGDYIWLKNNGSANYVVKITWWDLDGDREGYCTNNFAPSAGWTVCNKDFPEGHRIAWYVVYHADGQWWSGSTQTTTV
ncbi:hypothetical protein [Glycomyces niveus]|jgi:hypothetical protein|uniref:Secreted protein n=1 Tax=Glycomyces niveus TaxID=2820287 RepID=A0ABS3U2T9_9ACTN|nr:hypothetical protein [Glycomyces sp. NEAU-S30]MBO3733079.1 hypothetical protein [Glycomyces sp. NEAU-S30]